MAKNTVEHALRELARFNGEGGSCWDAASNLKMLNRVRELIYERGDYEGTMDWGCIALDDCACLYLPFILETVRQAWIANTPVLVHNQHYMSLDSVGRKHCCDCSADTRRAVQVTGIRRPIIATPEKPFKLLVVPEAKEDAEIVFRGSGYDGASFEVVINLNDHDPQKELGERVRDVTEVVKPATQNRVVVFSVSDDGQKLLADYPAESINPRFSQMRVINYRKGDCDRGLVVLAKKTFLPLTRHNQLVDIESLAALRFGYQAMNAQTGNRDEEYISKVRLMEDQLSEVDQNLSLHEGAVEGQPVYASSVDPTHDAGDRI